MAFAIVSQCAGVIFVESMEKSWRQVTSQSAEISGTFATSCSLVSAGVSPLCVISEAIVPPVPSMRTFFIGCLSPFAVF